MNATKWISTVIVAAALAACNTVPPRPAALDEARTAVDAARASPRVATYAGGELQDAVKTYERAEAMLQKEGDTDEVRHLAYLARQRVAIAQETARLRYAEQAIASASAERERVRLAARAAEADVAKQDALRAQARAELARSAAAEAEARAQLAQQSASSAQQQAQAIQERNALLEGELRQLSATKSDRGMVVTLNDVLFDTGSATLRPGGQRLVARLAQFLREYPERTIAIEGFTDSVGSEDMNQALSERRASAVRIALTDAGIDPSRVLVRGYGEAYPVASNDTAEGRQRNRRVEVVISDEHGGIAPRVAAYVPR